MTQQTDPYLTDLYNSLHDSPMQQKFRRIRPLPVGAVFLQWPGETLDDMREHMRLMKRLGYTCLKGIGLRGNVDLQTFMNMALDEGIIPWWYGEAGWEDPTPELLETLGIPADTSIEDLRENKTFLAHQDKVMRDRIAQECDHSRKRPRSERKSNNEGEAWRYSSDVELRTRDVRVEEEAMPMFVEWLKDRYGDLEELKKAWNCYHVGLGGRHWETWEEAAAAVQPGTNDRGYNRFKDVIRFKSWRYIEQLKERLAAGADDPNAPTRAGGEISVFLPVLGRGVDMEGVAELMTDVGSFYPSTHLAWHFDTVDYEITRTIYMYSALMRDWFKGGWAATWESTGGPQQISGDKGWSVRAARSLPAFTVDENVMTQFMLTYLGAGYRGFGFWCWSARTAGREGGEYALLDRNNQPGERAKRVGMIGRAARRLRDELWQANKEPLVGVLVDPENDILWAVMADFGRDLFAEIPVKARVGAGRAFINANVPWEHVSAKNLRQRLANRYKMIYLPAIFGLTTDVFEILTDYVKDGGRLVMDMPSAYFDELARITNTGKGSPFEQLFGTTIDDFQYSSNVPRGLHGKRLTGFVVDMTPTTAKVLARYDCGKPCITENAFGKGTAVILGYEASLMCNRPGNEERERQLVDYTLGDYRSPYACDGAIVYRIAAPAADHYFLINDGPARSVTLTTDFRYSAVSDPVFEKDLALGAPIEIDAYSGRWLRFSKS